MTIFLIGPPGVGKSTLGLQTAEGLNWAFFDTDVEIEGVTQNKITQIFAEKGETRFRELERAVLLNVIENAAENKIVSCGGGLPCAYNQINILKTHGKVIFLSVSVDELKRRLSLDQTRRPLLANGFEALDLLIQTRLSVYTQAHFTYMNENTDVEDFIQFLALHKIIS